MGPIIAIPKESKAGETRVALDPESVSLLITKGYTVRVESNAGALAQFSDKAYQEAGAEIIYPKGEGLFNHFQALFRDADMVIRVKRATRERERIENKYFKKGATLIGFLDPFDKSTSHMAEWQDKNLTLLSLDQLNLPANHPANALAKMSQLTGELALDDALERVPKAQQVLILGAGNVGLSALYAALKRGLKVMLASTRQPDCLPQDEVEFVSLSDLSIAKQREIITPYAKKADIILATARRQGEVAPLLIDEKILGQLKKGTVIVDLALTEGGNVEGSQTDKTILSGNGVVVTNTSGYPKFAPTKASQIYASAMVAFLASFKAKRVD